MEIDPDGHSEVLQYVGEGGELRINCADPSTNSEPIVNDVQTKSESIECEVKPCVQGDIVELQESEKEINCENVQGDTVEMTKSIDKYNECAACVMCCKTRRLVKNEGNWG